MIESFSPVDLTAALAAETGSKAGKSSTRLLVIIVIIILAIIAIALFADYQKNGQLERTKQ